jgi:hypothetical protein
MTGTWWQRRVIYQIWVVGSVGLRPDEGVIVSLSALEDALPS